MILEVWSAEAEEPRRDVAAASFRDTTEALNPSLCLLAFENYRLVAKPREPLCRKDIYTPAAPARTGLSQKKKKMQYGDDGKDTGMMESDPVFRERGAA